MSVDVDRLSVLEAFTDMAHDALFAEVPVGRIAVWSRGAERVFGYRTEEVLGRPAADLFPERLRDDVLLLFDIALGGEPVDHVDTEARRQDGMAVPISLSLRAVAGFEYGDEGIVAVVQDLTEQRLAQATLAETEARMREAEALAHVGRWLWDVATGTVQWSGEMHRIHGIDPLDFGGTIAAHLSAVHADDVSRVQAALDGAVASGRDLDVSYLIRDGSGSARRVRARAAPAVDSLGTVVGLRGTVTDLSGGGG